MISVDISLSEGQLKNVRDSLLHIPGAANKAIARAINKAAEKARTEGIKAICGEYAIKPSDVRKTIHIVRARPGNLSAQIISTGGPIPLIKFHVTPREPPAKGTKVKDREVVIAGVKFGNAVAMPYSFIAMMKNGHVGVYSRKKGAARNPIEQHYSPAVPQMLGNKAVQEIIEEQALKRLDKELRHQISYLFSGGR
jgi:hypothetical protein